MVVGCARCSQICLLCMVYCCGHRSCVVVSFGSSSRSVSVSLDEVFGVVVLMSSFYSSDFHSSNYGKDLVVHMYCVWNTFKPGNFITKRSKVN